MATSVYVEYECKDCDHVEERDTRLVRGETEHDDDHEPVDPVESCPMCGGEVTEELYGGLGLDEGREDFHSDG